jgi:hypothetical protein
MSSIEDLAVKNPADQKPKGWTVMVYMAAAQNEQTELAAIEDIKELEKIDTEDKVNVVVQIDRAWPGYPQRYCIEQGHSEPRPDKRLSRTKDMSTGESEPLRQFVRWTRKYKPARRYMLVLWGHAYGLGFGRDHSNALTMPELASALRSCEPSPWVDLLGVNACAMSYAEAAYELREAAQFLVAPEITMPLQGWPYDEILSKIVSNPEIGPQDLGRVIVDRYMESFGGKNVSLTLLDLGKAKYLQPGLQTLATALMGASQDDGTKGQVASAFLDTAYGDVRPLIDFDDLCENLARVKNPDVNYAAAAMRRLLVPEGDGLIVHHRADPELEGLHGLGIFALSVTGAADLTRLELSERNYKALALMQDTQFAWAKLVYGRLRALLDSPNKAIAAFVKGQGAASREDRTGVAQLLVSVYRAFARLQETVASVKTEITNVLNDPRYDPANKQQTPYAGVASSSNGKRYLRLRDRRGYGDDAPAPVATSPVADATTTGNGHDPLEDRRRDALTVSLRQIEDALEKAEKTMRRVVTHGRLGLGDSDTPFKPTGLGDSDTPFKPTGLGDSDTPFKPTGLGESIDSGFIRGGFGLMPLLFASSEEVGTLSGAKIVAGLYRQIAGALYEIEDAVAKLENAVLTNGTCAPTAAGPEHEQATDEVERSFRQLEDALASAQETSSFVLQHPSYGLGPGSEPGLGAANRQQLATAVGLGPRVLRLL